MSFCDTFLGTEFARCVFPQQREPLLNNCDYQGTSIIHLLQIGTQIHCSQRKGVMSKRNKCKKIQLVINTNVVLYKDRCGLCNFVPAIPTVRCTESFLLGMMSWGAHSYSHQRSAVSRWWCYRRVKVSLSARRLPA